MVKYESIKQLRFEDFIQPFGNNVDFENRWVKLSQNIPWDELAEVYYDGMSKTMGAPAKDARVVIGSMIIKHKLNLTDEETAEQIRENFYMQYFVGMAEYKYRYVFVPSLFVEIRKRLGIEKFTELNNIVISKGIPKNAKKRTDETKVNKDDDSDKPEPPVRQGKLIIDATVANQAIKYPNDLDLLNQSREISEEIIDYLYASNDFEKKPRTYRKKARKAYLSVAKLKRKNKNTMRNAISKQLNYLKRNLGSIARMMEKIDSVFGVLLPEKLEKKYKIIQQVYAQQSKMHKYKIHSCENRIVSISQPHVRPIVRGKTGKPVEFGAKLGVSLIDGFARIDNFSWDAYNEGTDLRVHLENYQKNYGCLPESVLADNIYGSRENRKLLKDLGIKFSGKPLGRQKTETEENKADLAEEKKRRKKEYRERIPIEGKFGQGKNGYRLNYIRAKTKATSESWVSCIFFVMNIVKLAKRMADFIFSIFLYSFFESFFDLITRKYNSRAVIRCF